MFRFGLLHLLALGLLLALLVPTAIGMDAVQDPTVDKRPEVAALVAKLESLIVKKGAGDMDAIGIIDQLNQEFPKSGPKDKALIVKSLAKCFEQRRLEPDEEKAVNNKLNIAAAAALGQMAPESTKTLIALIGSKELAKDIGVQQRLIKSLGKTRDKDGIKTLVAKLQDKESMVVSTTAEALGEFASSDLATRKSVYESLLKTLMTAKSNKDQNANDLVARDRYDVIAAQLVTSLGKLAKHDERDPEKCQAWWNKNRTADWDTLK